MQKRINVKNCREHHVLLKKSHISEEFLPDHQKMLLQYQERWLHPHSEKTVCRENSLSEIKKLFGPSDLVALRSLFNAIDLNHNGIIDKRECMLAFGDSPTGTRVMAMMDDNGDGLIQEKEWYNFFAKTAVKLNVPVKLVVKSIAKHMFSKTSRKAKSIINPESQVPDVGTENRIRVLFQKIDTDHDLGISDEEMFAAFGDEAHKLLRAMRYDCAHKIRDKSESLEPIGCNSSISFNDFRKYFIRSSLKMNISIDTLVENAFKERCKHKRFRVEKEVRGLSPDTFEPRNWNRRGAVCVMHPALLKNIRCAL